MDTDTSLKTPSTSHFRAEIKGATSFCVNQAENKIEAEITIGYRNRPVKSGVEKHVYAVLKAKNKDGITLSDLIKACGGNVAIIPAILNNGLSFRSFSISYGSGERSSDFTIAFETQIDINGTRFNATVAVNYRTKSDGSKFFTFGGILKINKSHQFDLRFTSGPDAKYLFANYRHKGEQNIALREIGAAVFGNDDAAKMPDVSLKLKEFTAFLLYKIPAEGESSLVFGMGANLGLSLQDMPMAGPILAREGSFSFQQVLVMYSKGSFTEKELNEFPGLPRVSVSRGFNISTCLLINNVPWYYILGGNYRDDGEKDKPAEPEQPLPAVVESVSGATSSTAKWTKIDKKLGPVNLQRLGFLYKDSKVVILLDATVAAAGMGMQLMGLGLGFKLEWPPKTPEFYIDGLGLSYTKDPIRISGMFTRVAPKPGIEVYSYYGAAQLSFSKFSISGIGAYSKLTRGDISFFIYAMYQGAIGGPAFFFVTGIAAGFGYNRSVRIPKITEVATFPLVAMALNPLPARSLDQILAELIAKDCIPASPGDYWLAIGVKFTTFKIIESFILVVVQFGTRTEFTILGLSILAWPDKKSPIAYVELALKASFGPDSEVMSIEAMLTSNSYILDKNCKLTGGFAFYAWVSGDHEGDFVITLGGYHPKFNKPAHYPDVQRLGLNWRISNELQIKGGLYYALTPSCIMAGGLLEITYTLSFLKGSIVIWADMLIAWAPFHYAIDMGICIRIDANIDVGLFTVKFNIEMGAQLHIWGPPFAGTVHVDWSVFAFTIPFGTTSAGKNEPLKWDQFRKQFLPGKSLPGKEDLVYDAAEISIASGIINEYEAGGEKYIIVNPHKLSVKVEAPVPVTKAIVGDSELSGNTLMLVNNENETYDKRNLSLGIRPMGAPELLSILTLKIDGVPGLVYSAYANSVPEALWSSEARKGGNSTPDDSKVLPKALRGVILSPKEVETHKGTREFNLDKKFTIINKELRWSYVSALTGPSNTAFRAPIRQIIIKELSNEIITGAHGIRQSIIQEALAVQGINENPTVNDDIQNWIADLSGTPVIVQVGGLPQYKQETGK